MQGFTYDLSGKNRNKWDDMLNCYEGRYINTMREEQTSRYFDI